MVNECYECEECESIFYNRTKAEEHEQIPLITLPKGFIYFFRDHPRATGWIRGIKLGIDESHEVRYFGHSLFNLHLTDVIPSITPNSQTIYARDVIGNITEDSNRYRHATEDEVREALSYEKLVDTLKAQGLTELTLDLEGKIIVPIEGIIRPTSYVRPLTLDD